MSRTCLNRKMSARDSKLKMSMRISSIKATTFNMMVGEKDGSEADLHEASCLRSYVVSEISAHFSK